VSRLGWGQGWEYGILENLLADESNPINLIDELMVEIHYSDPGKATVIVVIIIIIITSPQLLLLLLTSCVWCRHGVGGLGP
jgi:hypothetical protein